MNTHSFHHRMFRGALQAVPSVGVFLLTVLLVVQSGITQQRPEPPSPAMEVDRIARAMSRAQLALSTDQQKQIFSVYVDAQTAAQSSLSSTDEFARRQQMEALQTSVRKEVRALLTEAQQKVFDAMATQRWPGGDGNGPGAGGPPSGPPPSNSQN